MARGRKPQPTAKLKASGQYREDRHDRRDEPKVNPSFPDCPGYLSRVAKQEWKRICAELTAAGILTNLDRTILAMYCESYWHFYRAKTDLAKRGMVIKTKKGYPIQNPYLAIYNKAWDQMKTACAELGLTPSSRTRIKVEKPKAASDPKDRFFKPNMKIAKG